jgi:hypothetical protein
MSNLALPAIGDQTGMALGVQIMKWPLSPNGGRRRYYQIRTISS